MAQAGAGAGSWDPGMRVGDNDRERVVGQLREHHAAGRLTVDEFDERMRQAYDAKTFGDLDPLTRDLPIDLATIHPHADAAARYDVRSPAATQSGQVGGPFAMGPPPWARGRGQLVGRRGLWPMAIGSWLSLSTLLTAIWLMVGLTGGGWNFWPIWPIGITGVTLLMGKINGRGR